jgi:PilZ domain
MKIAGKEEQQKIRRKASTALLVCDSRAGTPIGRILDMSARGMKLVSAEPVIVRRIYYCRIPLKRKIDGCSEVFLDAECRWCRKSEETGQYNSGYIIRFPSPKDASIIGKLIHSWMADHANLMNARYIVTESKSQTG